MKRTNTLMLQVFAILVAGVLMAGCPDNDGPMEDMGEEIDDVVEEIDN